MKSPVLFIGYESSLRDEISEYLREQKIEAHFSDTAEDTLRIMHTVNFETAVLNMRRLEDAAILRYINIHYQNTHVLLMPGRQLKEAIPALATGRYDLLQEPFTLEELKKHI